MYGIENIKKLVGSALGFTKAFITTFQDGKFQLQELFNFVNEFVKVPDLVKSWPQIQQELADLSPEERTQLHEYFAANFDIPNDKLEVFIETALQNAISMIALVEMWKELKKKPEEPKP